VKKTAIYDESDLMIMELGGDKVLRNLEKLVKHMQKAQQNQQVRARKGLHDACDDLRKASSKFVRCLEDANGKEMGRIYPEWADAFKRLNEEINAFDGPAPSDLGKLIWDLTAVQRQMIDITR